MGAYILSRVGVSLVYHAAGCPLVQKYNLQDISVTDLSPDAMPCEECQPTFEAQLVSPEKLRHWALVTDDPEAILDALYKYDDVNKTRYLTNVATRLLEDSSEQDPEIDSAYHIELIP